MSYNEVDIPDNNHIIRHCSKRYIDSKKNLPTPEIFALRLDKNETYLSCFWLEFWNSDMNKIKIDLSKRRKIKSKDKNALISIEKMKSIINDFNNEYKIKVKHDRNLSNDSYSKVYPIPVNIFNNEKLQIKLVYSVEKICDIT